VDLKAKVAAFCRELSVGELVTLAADKRMTDVLEHAQEAVKQGHLTPQLGSDLDRLDELLRRSGRLGMYPPVVRGFAPVPGATPETGAQWWTCPRDRCAGRGRVRPGQTAPVCSMTGQMLVPRPLSA
jgi:hypothetical protein